MRTTHSSQGNVLVVTLLLIMVLVMAVAFVMDSTATAARNTNRSRNFIAAQAAADGAVDFAFAVWVKKTNNAHTQITPAQCNSGLVGPSFSGTDAPPGTPGFVYYSGTFYSANGAVVTGSLTITALDKYGVPLGSGTIPDPVIGRVSGYPGWWGRTYTYAATAVMVPDTGATSSAAPTYQAGARRLFQYSEVPLFQTMYFFNDNLEIYNPSQTTISGLVHTNGNLYLMAQPGYLTFYGQVTYSGAYSAGAPPGGSNYVTSDLTSSLTSATFYPGTPSNPGSPSAPSLSPVMQAMGPSLTADFPPPYGTNTAAGASTDPNLMNGYHELIEPPSTTTTDPTELSQRRLYNNAGMIVQIGGTSITTSNTAFTTINPTTHALNPVAGAANLIAAQQGASIPTTPGTAYTTALNDAVGFLSKQVSTNTQKSGKQLYDAREGEAVNVVNVDVGKFNAFISDNMSGAFNGVLYVYDTTTSSAPNTVRLQDGAVLPSSASIPSPKNSLLVSDGLTVASQNPVYIQGDYNTGDNPASSGGSVTASSSPTGTMTVAGNTTPYSKVPSAVIGDAIMLLSNGWSDANSNTSNGINSRIASNTTFNTAMLGGWMGTTSTGFSGGAVNYPRFLEDWTNKSCTYWGSMVELFPSKTFTQLWQTPGTYYNPPTRYYNYDSLFSHRSPPGTVAAIVLSRSLWSRYP